MRKFSVRPLFLNLLKHKNAKENFRLYTFLLPIKDLPYDIPIVPSHCKTFIDSGVSLFDPYGPSGSILMAASRIRKCGQDYSIEIGDEQGIIDGLGVYRAAISDGKAGGHGIFLCKRHGEEDEVLGCLVHVKVVVSSASGQDIAQAISLPSSISKKDKHKLLTKRLGLL